MEITLKGNNGEKVVIPIENLIQKYWSDENSKPNRIEMSAKVKDETILAAMTICDEKEETKSLTQRHSGVLLKLRTR